MRRGRRSELQRAELAGAASIPEGDGRVSRPASERDQRSGKVRSFDAQAGVGEIEDDEGRTLPFHCTALIDGTRTINVGATVEFEVAPSHFGRWEAAYVSRT